jgi:hypothetical protein
MEYSKLGKSKSEVEINFIAITELHYCHTGSRCCYGGASRVANWPMN